MSFCLFTINLCLTYNSERRHEERETCRDETVMERSKVRQARVFLAQQPTETEVNKRRTNEF